MAFLRRGKASDAPADDPETGDEKAPDEDLKAAEVADEEADGADSDADESEDEVGADEEEGAEDEEPAEEESDEPEGESEEDTDEEAPPIIPRTPMMETLGRGFKRARKWRGWTPTLLILIFLLALFVRSYFYFQEAQPDYLPPGNWLLSGNDPDYHKRAVDYLDANHRWLAWDPLQNYPQGGPNPNPPAYETAVLLIGYMLTPFAPDTVTAVWWSMQFGGALWAALTIFPVFFVAREMFGRRAGLIAAFLIGVMAGNIERTPVGFSDHDGFYVFFLVCGFYFFIRAMEYTRNREYVHDWKSLDSVAAGFLAFAREQRIAILYTMMATTMWGIVGLTWKGFPYIYAILLVYYFVSVIALRWYRREDPFAVAVLTMISFTWIIAMTIPFYYLMHFMHWYDIYYLLWSAAALVTLFFVPTRNVPAILIIFVLAVLGALVFFGLSAFAPDIADTIFSGGGYFSRSKLYTTIAEAQPPDVSRLVASYGYATSMLAIGGLGLMMMRLPRKWSNAYVLMLAWAAAAIYMALTAVRFMYNATPLFAILAGWILWGIIDRTHFSIKTYRERWRKFQRWRKVRTVPIAHYAVALFVAFAVIFSNTLQGLDAGVPFETKRQWDRVIYDAMPDVNGSFPPLSLFNDVHVFRPSPEVFNPVTPVANQQPYWYLGAFGTSYMNDYWAVAMKWLSTQDREVPEAQRPGFISWWDYGHWAMHVGEHPTAADNFQNGFEFAGNFIGARGEDEGNSLILARYLETVRGTPAIDNLAKKYLGDDGWAEFERYAADPTSFNAQILANPEKYNNRDKDISERNAFYILVSGLISEKVSPADRVWWIREVKQQTGFELRYFAVDVRLMPFSASNTGIFYAPIILADFDRNEFVELLCSLDNGQKIPCDQVTNPRTVTATELVYKQSFYDSMFTRAYLGYTANDLKASGTFNGFPGIQSSCTQGQTQTCLAGQAPMQGWNMSHWRLVQRSVYFNPNATDLANHTEEWKIITEGEADQYEGNKNVTVDRQFLGLGERTGTGVMYLKYYAGAFINGTLRTAEGTPVPNARITVYDDVKLSNPSWPGVPHGYGFTDANGSYSVTAPFGNVTLIASTGGGADPFQLRETVELGRAHVVVTDDQAMRLEQDLDGDGAVDYNIAADMTVVPGAAKGRAFLDKDSNGVYSRAADELLAGAHLNINSSTSDVHYAVVASADGNFDLQGVAPGLYNVTASYGGHEWRAASATRINGNASTVTDVALKPGRISGRVTGLSEEGVANSSVVLLNLQTQVTLDNLTGADGRYAFLNLFPGNYTLRSNSTNTTPFEAQVSLGPGGTAEHNFSVITTVPAVVTVYMDLDANGDFTPGEGAANATLEITAIEGVFFNLTRTGANGTVDTRYPPGNYSLRAQYFDALQGAFAAVTKAELNASGGAFTVRLLPATHLNGTVFRDENGNGTRDAEVPGEVTFAGAEVLLYSETTGELTRVLTRADGGFDAVLPRGLYHLQVADAATGLANAQVAFLTVDVLGPNLTVVVPLVNGTKLTGRVGFDADRSGLLTAGLPGGNELIVGANVTLTQGPFKVAFNTTAAGDFTVWLKDGNWSVATRAPGYAPNTTFKVVNATDAVNNTLDIFLNATPVTWSGRIGFDRDGDGNLTAAEGFDNVTIFFEAEPSAGPFGFGENATVVSGADGNFSVALAVGHYKYNVSIDRGTGSAAHRYESVDAAAGSKVFHPFIQPNAEPLRQNISLSELTRLQAILCYDADNAGGCQFSERPAGVSVTLRGPGAPITFTTGTSGVLDDYVPSGLYTAEASYNIPGGGVAKTFLDLNLTAPQSLGLVKLKTLSTLTVHLFDDRNVDGLENDAADPASALTVFFTNVTGASAEITAGNGTVLLLSGRTYLYSLDQKRTEVINNVSITVWWKAEGNFTFDGSTTVFNLGAPRRLQVAGAFYWDRNGDGRYSPGSREEPQGAFIEFRNASNPSDIVLSQEVPSTGAYEAFVPLGAYNITVAHSGFDTSNASWAVTVTLTPPPIGFKVDIILRAHDVVLTGFTFLDVNRNGRLNAFETGTPVATLKVFNATNITDAFDLPVAPDGSFNTTLKPGMYNLYAAGDVGGTPVAGLAQAVVDPVGGLVWANVSLRQAFLIGGAAWYWNTTGSNLTTPPVNYTVTQGGIKVALPQPAGAYNLTLPDGTFGVNATVTTDEFGSPMNYTAALPFTVDLENISRDLNFTKEHRGSAVFTWAYPGGDPLPQGASVNYTVGIRNTGTDNATFDVIVPSPNLPTGWNYTLELTNVTLDIGASTSFWVQINTSNSTRAGNNTLQLRASPRNLTGEGGSLDIVITTRQDFGIDVRQDVDAPAETGGATNYFVAVENKGNGVDKVSVNVTGLPQGYTANLDRGAPGNEIELQPFRTERVQVTVTRDSTASRAPPGSVFVVTVRSLTDLNQTTQDSVTVSLAYPDLTFGNDANATRAVEPGRGSLVDNRPLTTPGFEVVAAMAAFAALAVARRRNGGRSP